MDNNTSGTGDMAVVPPEIDRWNWGAFLLSWIWGINHNVWRALLVFVPFFGLVMPFILGAKGSAWAWRHRRWESVDAFKAAQRSWAKWGIGLWIAGVVLFVGMFFSVFAALKNSDAYQLSEAFLRSNATVEQLIGTPIDTGIPSGNIRINGPSGFAELAFSVKGPKGEGQVFVKATKDMGRWTIKRMKLQQGDTWHDLVEDKCKDGCVST
jgi:hypothetical protein